jgi:hypothetical protein
LAGPVIGAAASEQMLERAFGLPSGKADAAGLLGQIEETVSVISGPERSERDRE